MAYLGVDIGGTKTLVGVLNDEGVIQEELKFPTPKDYPEFVTSLRKTIEGFNTKEFIATGVAAPGSLDRERGIVIALGNLPWINVPMKHDVEKITNSPVIVENDAALAGLSEAQLVKDEYKKVLYLTISTGIGGGIIINGIIQPYFADTEPGQMQLEHNGSMEKWEDFASGRAIVEKYGKQAHEITDPAIWRKVANNLCPGILTLTAILQPEVIIFGGGVGTYFDRYKDFLSEELDQYSNPLIIKPDLRVAGRPEKAVVYGCFELAKATYGNTNS